MEKINGIIISGKVYEVANSGKTSPCMQCVLHNECDKFDYEHHTKDFCIKNLGDLHFRFSPELTDKLKGE